MTALTSDLTGLGLPTALGNYLGEGQRDVTGYGTAQVSNGTALANNSYLILGFNTVTTSGGNTAVQILDTMPIGRSMFVNVTSATTALVFPPSGCTLQGQTTDAPASVAQNQPVLIMRVSRTAFIGITALVPGGGGGTGTVTSVTFTGDGTVLSSTPSSAVTTSGTLTAAIKTQTQNTVLAGSNGGGTVAPSFRALVAADLPTGTTSSASTIPLNNDTRLNEWPISIDFGQPATAYTATVSFPIAGTFAANLTFRIFCTINPTSTMSIVWKQRISGSTSTVGTISVSTAGAITGVANSLITVAAGDAFTFDVPADATAVLGISFAGTKT